MNQILLLYVYAYKITRNCLRALAHKHINKDTQEIPESQSTALPSTKRRRDKEQIRKTQTSHMKPQTHKADKMQHAYSSI